jgi:short-subunit dehydrogenase
VSNSKGKVLITGASSGIGLETAKLLLKHGIEVVGLSHIDVNDLGFPHFQCNLLNSEETISVSKSIISKHPDINMLVNCAGMGISGAMEYTTDQDLQTIFGVNVFGLMKITQLLIPTLRRNAPSKIINISSVAAEITIPFQTAYSMTKNAVISYTEGLRLELKPLGIDVGAVLPGDTKTSFTENRTQPTLPTDNVYGDRIKNSIHRMELDEQNGVPPLKVSKVILKKLSQKRMSSQTTVGLDYKFLVWLSHILPIAWIQAIVYRLYAK